MVFLQGLLAQAYLHQKQNFEEILNNFKDSNLHAKNRTRMREGDPAREGRLSTRKGRTPEHKRERQV